MKKCSGCNKQWQDDYAFCPTCGKKLSQCCYSCGKELPEEAIYCPYCGKKQQEAEAGTPAMQSQAPSGGRRLEQYCIYARCIPMSEEEKEFFTSMRWDKPDWQEGCLVWHWSETISGWRALDDGDIFDAGEEPRSLYIAKLTAKQQEQFLKENKGRFTAARFHESCIFGTFVKKGSWKPKTFSRYTVKNAPDIDTFASDETYIALAQNVIEEGDLYLIACAHWKFVSPNGDMIGFILEK